MPAMAPGRPEGAVLTLVLPYGKWHFEIEEDKPNEIRIWCRWPNQEGARLLYLVDGGEAS